MSLPVSVAAALFGGPPDNRIELVRKITTKTQQGKILWINSENSSRANVPGGLVLNFVESAASIIFTSPIRWVLFTVRDAKGNEVMRVANRSNISAAIGLPSPPPASGNSLITALLAADPLIDAVDELHKVIRSQAKGEVEKAIDLLDNI